MLHSTVETERPPGVADRLSLVFHLVDPLPVLLSKRGMAAHERDWCLGLHSFDHLRSRRTAQEFPADLVARIWPRDLWLAHYCWAAR